VLELLSALACSLLAGLILMKKALRKLTYPPLAPKDTTLLIDWQELSKRNVKLQYQSRFLSDESQSRSISCADLGLALLWWLTSIAHGCMPNYSMTTKLT
jgi:hypothetical protein